MIEKLEGEEAGAVRVPGISRSNLDCKLAFQADRRMLAFRTSLQPKQPPVPFLEILAAWQRAAFAPAACRAELERLIDENEIPPGLFDPAEITRGGRPATDELLFGWYARGHEWIWQIDSPSGARLLEVSPEAVSSIADLVRAARDAESPEAFSEIASGFDHDEDLIRLLTSCLTDDASYGCWPAADAPGLYRREHASLVLRTPGSSLITDPQSLSSQWTTNFGRYPADPRSLRTSRVLLTHGHSDHWDLCSFLRWSQEDEPVIVPRVPAPSLLADDARAQLELAGQAAIAPEWCTSLRIDDVEIDVLPFYGEQPTRDLPLPFPLRNWGNCYRFNTAEWSAVVLVDSGTDAEGTMTDAIRRSVATRGPIDIVLSCCDEFPEAINPGLPHYLLTIPFDHLRRYARRRASITSGPRGLAEICEAAQARWFLPYAHGFDALGKEPISGENTTSEAELAAAVARALAERGAGTEVLGWSPGDYMVWKNNRPVIRRQ